MALLNSGALGVGEHVTIPGTDYGLGTIIEERGALGPGGSKVYLVGFEIDGEQISVELREDQLKHRPEPKTVTFEEIAQRLKAFGGERRGIQLAYPEMPKPFVAQTLTAEVEPGQLSLDSDFFLFRATAAVGKSTFAKALAAKSGIPVLDLAKIKVSNGSLTGIVIEELGSKGFQDLLEGRSSLIIDAMDEGLIF